MTKRQVIKNIATEIHRRFEGEGTGHDWWHVWRVWQMARRIGKAEAPRQARGINMLVVELAALLHDIADWKFHNDDWTAGSRAACTLLTAHRVDAETIAHVCDIVDHVSFKGAGVKTMQKTIEGKIVQDADRLDAIGAIGIARAFVYGGKMERPLYDPEKRPKMHTTTQSYAAARHTGTTINHFFEKLLLLKDRLNTRTARKIAAARHRFMREYLQKFFQEWEGKN